MVLDAGRIKHLADLMHKSIASNGSAIASNWRLSADGLMNTVWSPESATSVSYGSNSNDVSFSNAAGASALAAKADHVHRGVTSLAHASNTFTGPVTLETEGSLYIVRSAANTYRLGATGGAAGGGSGTLTTVKDEGSTLSTAVVSIDFQGAGVTATGTTAVVVTIPGGGGSAYPPLDQYSIDGTYGDHFTAASLSGSWTRRNFTSGAESYQQGPNSTYMRIAFTGRAVGDGYFRTAPAGDWTFAMAFVPRFYDAIAAKLFGIAVVDTAGTGVWLAYGNGSPAAFDLLQLTTYTTYGGNYVEAGYNGANPNVSYVSPPDVPSMHRKMWLRLRKSGTNYYGSFSLDGELWGVESSALAWAGTVDRVGFIYGPLSTGTLTNGYVDMDWFNKI